MATTSIWKCVLLMTSFSIASGSGVQPILSATGLTLEGSSLALTCEIFKVKDSNMTFTFSWFANRTLVHQDLDNTFTLNISRSDTGNYTCSVKDEDGTEVTSAPIFVDVKFSPEIAIRRIVPTLSHDVREGDTVSWVCDVTAANPPVPEDGFRWSYLPLHSDVTTVAPYLSESRQLTIEAVLKSDGGVYTCEARNDRGLDFDVPLARETTMLDVVFIPVVRIEPSPTTGVLQEVAGGFLTLTCVVTEANPAVPACGYAWSYVPYMGATRRISVSNESRIVLSRLTKASSGFYTCQVRNGEGRKPHIPPGSVSIGLDVLYAPVVHIEHRGAEASEVRMTSGSTQRLVCVATDANPDVPADGYRWSYLPLSSHTEVNLTTSSSVLTLDPVTRSSSGQYVCRARNDEDIEFSWTPAEARVQVNVLYLENINMSENVQVAEGDDVTLSCDVDSYPSARLTWQTRGQDLREVTSNFDSYVIRNVTCMTAGDYTCRTRNDVIAGKTLSSTVSVLVHCVPRIIDSVESTVTAYEGGTASLSISVLAYPRPTFKWNGPSKSWILMGSEAASDNNASLTLRNLERKNSGVYTVTVTNDLGTLTYSFHLKVKERFFSELMMKIFNLIAFFVFASTFLSFLGAGIYLAVKARQKKPMRETRVAGGVGNNLDPFPPQENYRVWNDEVWPPMLKSGEEMDVSIHLDEEDDDSMMTQYDDAEIAVEI